MLKIVRRLGLGSTDAPSIPGMQVVDWRVVELRTNKVIIALCHKESALWVALYDDDLPPDISHLTEASTITELETELRLDSVDLTNIYPAYTAQFALYCEKATTGKVNKEVFVKHTQILDLVSKGMSTIQTSRSAGITAHEASICERLAMRSHPNIAEYLGVQVRDALSFSCNGRTIDIPLARNSVLGLVFRKYDCNLHEIVIRRQKLDVKACLQAVAAGLQHLHGMGVVHGDVRPQNVYVKRGRRDQFVIGDFDAAHTTGSVVMFKTGDAHWCRRKKIGVDIAQEEDDWSAFRKLIEWVVCETGGKLADYKGIGKKAPKAP